MHTIRYYLPPVARLLMSAIFILSGIGKLTGWSEMAGYMAAKGMPAVPLLLGAATFLEIFGGLSLLLGWKPRLGAALLFLFLIPTTLIFHNFWALAGAERMDQMTHFLKNLAILGGLLMVAVIPERDVKLGAGETEIREYESRAA
jgi:putative oxidoreductase